MQHETIGELLAAWDAGEIVWSVELGGLGPGYEQAIQIAAVEMARDGIGIVLPDDKDERNEAWDRLCSASLAKHNDSLGGLSGAQYGAAKWLAYQWVHNGGPAALQVRVKEQKADRIMISRSFPRAAA